MKLSLINRSAGVFALAVFAFMCSLITGSPAEAADKTSARSAADSIAAELHGDSELLPSFDSTTTINDYLRVGMRRNPGLKSAYNRWLADLKKSDYAGSLPDPMFSYGYFVEHVETRVGPQKQRFSLRQSFPWLGTLSAKEDIAFEASQTSYRRFESIRLRLFYQIKSAYYDFYYLGRDLRITRENFELLKFWESVAESKYKVGLKKHPDVIKVQVELGKLEDHLRTLEERREPVEARLRALLNLPDSVHIPVPSRIDVVESELKEDSVRTAIIRNNPDLQALENIVEREQAGVSLASREALPDFTIGIDYIQTGEALNPDMAESGKDPWIISAGISLPIWFGKNKARKDEARARVRAAEYHLYDSRNELTSTTERVLFEYSDALRKTRLYRDGLVPKAEQSLNASYAAYQSGEADFLNVLDAQRQLLNFELTVAREQVRLATTRAQLEMLSGEDLDAYLQH